MVTKIRINPIATGDLQEIKDYISEDNIDAATRTIKDIVAKIESLSKLYPKWSIYYFLYL